jgi:hypothetical protein
VCSRYLQCNLRCFININMHSVCSRYIQCYSRCFININMHIMLSRYLQCYSRCFINIYMHTMFSRYLQHQPRFNIVCAMSGWQVYGHSWSNYLHFLPLRHLQQCDKCHITINLHKLLSRYLWINHRFNHYIGLPLVPSWYLQSQ